MTHNTYLHRYERAQTIGRSTKHFSLAQNKTEEEVAYASYISRSILISVEKEKNTTILTPGQLQKVLDILYLMDTSQKGAV